jgi:hypothetical protein
MVNELTCSCGAPKAIRARACFDCLAVEPSTPSAYVKVAIGEPGPRFYAFRADGTSQRFATHKAATEWAGVA